MPLDIDSLQLLQRASRMEDVELWLLTVFQHRYELHLLLDAAAPLPPQPQPQPVAARAIDKCVQTLQPPLEPAQVEKLVTAIDQLIRQVLFTGIELKDMAGIFPRDINPNLRDALCKIIAKYMPEWRKSVVANQVSPPKLIDFDWRVDMKTSSNYLSRMSVPTVLVDMTVQQQPEQQGVMPGIEHIQFELSKETLATMLDGLNKIRDQLGSMK